METITFMNVLILENLFVDKSKSDRRLLSFGERLGGQSLIFTLVGFF